MSNRPQFTDPEPDRPDTTLDEKLAARLDEALAARLACATPRSSLDATAIHYEAGYRAGLAEIRAERRAYRGLVAVAALVATVAVGWEFYVHRSLRAERDALIAAAATGKPQAPFVAGAESGANQEQNTSADERLTQQVPEPPGGRTETSAVAKAKTFDGFALDRLATFDRGVSMRRSDIYDLSPLSVSVRNEAVPATTSTSPSSHAPAPWTAFPSPRRMHDLLEEGI